MNNKGFTLVELLAVIVILLAIALMSSVGINAIIGRNKDKANSAKEKIIISAGILYSKDNKNKYDYNSFIRNECGVSTDWLVNNNYLSSDDLIDDEKKTIIGCIMYNNGNYQFIDERKENCKHC